MAKPQDIVARTFQFALSIVDLANQLDDGRGSTRVLTRQILRSGTLLVRISKKPKLQKARPTLHINIISLSRKHVRQNIGSG